MMFQGSRTTGATRGVQFGKGTRDFDAYVRNLHRACWVTSVSAQLATRDLSSIRGALVHNPYSKTIADLNICDVRSQKPL